MSYSSESPTSRPFDDVMKEAASPDWHARAAAAQLLATRIGEPRAIAQLVRMLDDSDTAVVEVVVEGLVKKAGVDGLSEVLKVLASNGDNLGYHIRDTLVALWLDGVPVLELTRELLARHPSRAVCDGAAEVVALMEDN